MPAKQDIRIEAISLYLLPVKTRIPLKFGIETTTHVCCARVRVIVSSRKGKRAEGWGETPLSAAWAWPSDFSYDARLTAMQDFCVILAQVWNDFKAWGHPMELGHAFLNDILPNVLASFNEKRMAINLPEMPWLSALLCTASFDIALFDAYGNLHGLPIFETLNSNFMNKDLAWFYGRKYAQLFKNKYPEDYLVRPAPQTLRAWHLVGGTDILTKDDLTGAEPNDGYPVVLSDWIIRDGLKCLKIKLTGTDAEWDYKRICKVGNIAIQYGVDWLSTDFNCTVTDPRYVCEILDRLMKDAPRIFGMILYIEQPFPYDLDKNRIDAHSVSARKPLFMDESAHDWKYLALGRVLGWTGVALKTCKTFTSALLSLCWAKAMGMTMMVQDLTNPMLAQIPHLQLAAHAGTIMGVETNAMQFYPDASAIEATVHPGVYRRKNGCVQLDSLGPTGFGYKVKEIGRPLPKAAWEGTQE
jgi:L-alanine-DL-glutamate epimerase-like enolase superfamily enzyme